MTKLAGNKNASTWAPEHTEELRYWVGQGISFAEAAFLINEEFGTNYTRNATVGKAHRIKLKAVYKQRQAKAPEKPRHRPGRYKPAITSQRPPTVAELYVPRCDEIVSGNLTLLEVAERDGCRWPTNDVFPFRFCAAPRIKDKPYCLGHLHASLRSAA